MALTLKLTAVEQNDNKALIFLDASGVYSVTNTTGWGSPNYELSEVDGTTGYNLTLQITIYTPTTTYICNAINLYNTFAKDSTGTPITWQLPTELVFSITPDLLIDSTTNNAIGVKGDDMPDGIYDVTYAYDIDTTTTTQVMLFISGVVRNKIYNMLVDVPDLWSCNNILKCKEIDNALYAYTLLKGCENCAYIAEKSRVLNGLKSLQKLTVNDIWQ